MSESLFCYRLFFVPCLYLFLFSLQKRTASPLNLLVQKCFCYTVSARTGPMSACLLFLVLISVSVRAGEGSEQPMFVKQQACRIPVGRKFVLRQTDCGQDGCRSCMNKRPASMIIKKIPVAASCNWNWVFHYCSFACRFTDLSFAWLFRTSLLQTDFPDGFPDPDP